jgi:hypothetical protein
MSGLFDWLLGLGGLSFSIPDGFMTPLEKHCFGY